MNLFVIDKAVGHFFIKNYIFYVDQENCCMRSAAKINKTLVK